MIKKWNLTFALLVGLIAGIAGLELLPVHHVNEATNLKSCNRQADAKALRHDEREKFMTQCLKG